MLKVRITAVILIILAALVGYFSFKSSAYPYKLGLDLSGGSHLVYQADVSAVSPDQIGDAMNALSADITHRINIFGVSEPIVQTEEGGEVGHTDYRLIVELPGVTNISQAEATIGKTPELDFLLIGSSTAAVSLSGTSTKATSSQMTLIPTGLTGALVKSAQVEYNQTTYQPYIGLTFNDAGAKLFDTITKNNVGKELAIFLDGTYESAPERAD